MKKTVGICFFAAVLAAAALILFLPKQDHRSDEEKYAENAALPQKTTLQTETEENTAFELTESMAMPKEYAYVIRVKDGILVVYQRGIQEEYFETNIRLAELEDAMVKKAEAGIYFQNEQELYTFLESYSS